MGLLTDAIEAAEERKRSALGSPEENEGARLVATPESNLLLVLNGYDIDKEEYSELVTRAGFFFSHLAAASEESMHSLFSASWADAFLVGLMYAKLHRQKYE